MKIELTNRGVVYASPEHVVRIVPHETLDSAVRCVVHFTDGGTVTSTEDPEVLDRRRTVAVRNLYGVRGD